MDSEGGERRTKKHVMTEEIVDVLERIDDPIIRIQVANEVKYEIKGVIEAAQRQVTEADPFYQNANQ
jgi:hypothetical protein